MYFNRLSINKQLGDCTARKEKQHFKSILQIYLSIYIYILKQEQAKIKYRLNRILTLLCYILCIYEYKPYQWKKKSRFAFVQTIV